MKLLGALINPGIPAKASYTRDKIDFLDAFKMCFHGCSVLVRNIRAPSPSPKGSPSPQFLRKRWVGFMFHSRHIGGNRPITRLALCLEELARKENPRDEVVTPRKGHAWRFLYIHRNATSYRASSRKAQFSYTFVDPASRQQRSASNYRMLWRLSLRKLEVRLRLPKSANSFSTQNYTPQPASPRSNGRFSSANSKGEHNLCQLMIQEERHVSHFPWAFG
ncbi:hypothetical protein VNO77_19927 [Canavalia gladiata]|uniref:Uncharacterized protein n=1 Tax=Canavalia gladiata TaxID=3824 RepID=A0AAN9LNE7_CANGL